MDFDTYVKAAVYHVSIGREFLLFFLLFMLCQIILSSSLPLETDAILLCASLQCHNYGIKLYMAFSNPLLLIYIFKLFKFMIPPFLHLA